MYPRFDLVLRILRQGGCLTALANLTPSGTSTISTTGFDTNIRLKALISPAVLSKAL